MIMQHTWAQDHALLALIFQAQGGAHVKPRVATDGSPAAADGAGDSDYKRAMAHADMFFLQTLLVAPNRFRPMSVLNDQKYEHVHNIVLGKVLKTCLDIADLHSMEQGLIAAGAYQGDMVAKYLGHCKLLQNHVRIPFQDWVFVLLNAIVLRLSSRPHAFVDPVNLHACAVGGGGGGGGGGGFHGMFVAEVVLMCWCACRCRS